MGIISKFVEVAKIKLSIIHASTGNQLSFLAVVTENSIINMDDWYFTFNDINVNTCH